MPLIIDAHEDLAYNILSFNRDYRRPAAETRKLEENTGIPALTGQALLGWPDYQRGQVALVVGTLFIVPDGFKGGDFETLVYRDFDEADRLYHDQYDLYRRLADDNPDMFRLVRSRADLQAVLAPWDAQPAHFPDTTHPVGLVMSMEGAEGIRDPGQLEEWWQLGLRLIGPVWAGSRLCGGTLQPGGFTAEGWAMLDRMQAIGYTLDIAHMTEMSALQALDRYQGTVIASHANARALLKGLPGERHLSDLTIRRLVERDGIIGVVPFNRFLRPGWSRDDDRSLVTLDHLAAHIDYICQLAGDARHVALGTDFDGGFGLPEIPQELDTVADLPALGPVLARRGYSPEDIAAIFSANWRGLLERTLPA
ncbi:MAG: hypothetical protein GYA17_15175 [Chloroflexi bacterium]|nr:hypothetical protein [Chloroflexota bacterium]